MTIEKLRKKAYITAIKATCKHVRDDIFSNKYGQIDLLTATWEDMAAFLVLHIDHVIVYNENTGGVFSIRTALPLVDAWEEAGKGTVYDDYVSEALDIHPRDAVLQYYSIPLTTPFI